MVEPKVLVVYFSRTGNTRRLAEAIGTASGWDVEEIVDPTIRTGVIGYLRSGFEAALGRLTRLREPVRNPADYDLVVIGGPVWNASLSSPVRTYLVHHRAALRNVAFFLTMGGSGNRHVFAQMQRVVGQPPLGVLAVTEREVARGTHLGHARGFVEALRVALAGLSPILRREPAQPEARK